MSDIVERLRKGINQDCGGVTQNITFGLEYRAAEEITTLRAELEAAKAAANDLKRIVESLRVNYPSSVARLEGKLDHIYRALGNHACIVKKTDDDRAALKCGE